MTHDQLIYQRRVRVWSTRPRPVTGLAVHIGARVVGLAAAGEVLVSGTVKDLVAGSGIEFADRGTHALRGIADAWQLYSVRG